MTIARPASLSVLASLLEQNFCCIFSLDTGSPQTFIKEDVLEPMKYIGAASSVCETRTLDHK